MKAFVSQLLHNSGFSISASFASIQTKTTQVFTFEGLKAIKKHFEFVSVDHAGVIKGIVSGRQTHVGGHGSLLQLV